MPIQASNVERREAPCNHADPNPADLGFQRVISHAMITRIMSASSAIVTRERTGHQADTAQSHRRRETAAGRHTLDTVPQSGSHLSHLAIAGSTTILIGQCLDPRPKSENGHLLDP